MLKFWSDGVLVDEINIWGISEQVVAEEIEMRLDAGMADEFLITVGSD